MLKTNTKQLIIDVALKLLIKKGYDKTTVADIIKEADLSKGGLYHHFKSKEDILSEIAEIQAKEAAQIIEKIIKNKKLNELEKFNKIIAGIQTYKINFHKEKANLKEVFQKQIQDPYFQHKMMKMTKKIIVPYFRILFKEGVEHGVFKTKYPGELAEHYFDIMNSMQFSLIKPTLELAKKPENIKFIEQKLYFFQDLLERILGVKKGSILLAEPLLNRYLQK